MKHYNPDDEVYTRYGYYYKICDCCGSVLRSNTDDFKELL